MTDDEIPWVKFGWKRSIPWVKFGWIPQPPDRDLRFEKQLIPELKVETPPESADLSRYIKHVKNQLNLGSCTAHGGTSLFEAINVKLEGKDFLGSRLQVYEYARRADGGYPGDNGATCRSVIKALYETGVAPEAEWPYVESNVDVPTPNDVVTDAHQSAAVGYYLVDSAHGYAATLNNIKVAIGITGLPVVFGATVWKSILKVGSDGIIPLPDSSPPIGGHCMLFFGYIPGYFKVLNSWGEHWGAPFADFEGGMGLLPEYYVTAGLVSDCWTFPKESQVVAPPTATTTTYSI